MNLRKKWRIFRRIWINFLRNLPNWNGKSRINCKGCNSMVIIHSVSVSAWIVTMVNAIWRCIDMGFTHPITHIFDSRCRGLIRCWPAKRRRHWARQAAQTQGPSSGVNTGPAKRRKHWARQAASILGPSSAVNTGLTKRDKSWFFIPLPAFGHLPPQVGEGIFPCKI